MTGRGKLALQAKFFGTLVEAASQPTMDSWRDERGRPSRPHAPRMGNLYKQFCHRYWLGQVLQLVGDYSRLKRRLMHFMVGQWLYTT